MAISNKITATLNFIVFLCSIPVIAAGIWLATKPDNECVELLRWPVVVLGFLLFLVTLIGFIGAYRNNSGLLAVYLFCMAVLILLLLILLVIAFTVTRADGSYRVAGRGFDEYRLDGYSSWLRHRVTGSGSWPNIKTCLAVSDVCLKLNRQFLTADQFFLADISPLQSGCCKPPTSCGYSYMNPTTWVNPETPMNDPDCYIWNNERKQLCYNCSSCKAGLLGNLREEWRKANVILIVAVVVLVFVYLIACSAYTNAQTHNIFTRYKHGWI